MRIFKFKHILYGALIAYFFGISLWLIRYDNDSVKRNLGLVKNEQKYDIHVTADDTLAFHIWPRFGFSGTNIKIVNFEGDEKAFKFSADEFFIGINPARIFLAQMKPDYLEIEKGKFSLLSLNGVNDLLNNLDRFQLNQLKLKALDFDFLGQKSFKLTDSYLDMSRFSQTKLFVNGIYEDEFFHIDMQSDSLRDVFPVCDNWNIHFRSKLLGNTVEFTGLFNGELFTKEDELYHLNTPALDLEFVAIGGDLSKYNHFFKDSKLPDIGPYQVSFEIKGDTKLYHLNDFFFQFYNNKIKGAFKWGRQALHQTISGDLLSDSIKLDAATFKGLFDYLSHHLSSAQNAYAVSLNCGVKTLEMMGSGFENNTTNFQISPQHNFQMRWSGELKDLVSQNDSAWYLDISAEDMQSKDPVWQLDGQVKPITSKIFSEDVEKILASWPAKIERSLLQPKNTSTEVSIDVVSKGVSWQTVKKNMSGKILWQ